MVTSKGSLNDVAEIAELLVDTWQTAYKGIFTDAFLNDLKAEDQQRRHEHYLYAGKATYLLLRDDEQLIGFISYGPPRDPGMKGSIEIYAFYVRSAFQGQGWGTKLFESFQSDAGIQKVSVEVFKANPFLPFYLKKGFIKDSEGIIDIGGSPVPFFICEWCPSTAIGQ